MAYGIFLPQRWRRQPQGAVQIDWSNPSSNRLVALYNGAQGRFTYSRGATTYIAPSGASVPSIYGISPRLGSAQGQAFSTVGSVPTSTAMTIAFVTQWIEASWISYYLGLVDPNSLGNRLPTFYASPNMVMQYSDGSTKEVSSGVNAAAGVSGVHVVVYNPQAQTLRYTVRQSNGKSGTGVVSSLANFFYASGAGVSFAVGNGSNFTAGPHTTPVALYAQAAWTDAQVQSFLENPFQLFRPIRPILYSLPSAATAPTLSAATVIDITSTSARPRVTVTF